MKYLTGKNGISLSVIRMLLMMLFVLSIRQLPAQGTQTIRGKITDEITRMPLVGVNVLVMLENGKSVGNATDVDGNFSIPAVPLGRQTIRVTYMGYERLCNFTFRIR